MHTFAPTYIKPHLKNLDTKYRLKGLLLLVTYLLILAASALHTHECNDETFLCQDCLHHIEHNAHVSQSSPMDIDCVLCKIIHTSYTTPEALIISAAVLLISTLTSFTTIEIVKCKYSLPSLRAPPVIR